MTLRGRTPGLRVVRAVIEEAPGLEHVRGLVLATPDDAARVLEPFLAQAPAPEETLHEDGQATTHDADATALYVLMERHEWNVARLMSVTR